MTMGAALQERCFHFKSGMEILRSRYQTYGPLWAISRVLKHFGYLVVWLFLLPITITLHIAGFRRVTVFTDRIGHLSVEIDGLLKECRLGKLPEKRYFVLSLPHRIANPCLLHNYWSKLIPVVRNPFAVRILDIMTSRWLMRHNVCRMVLTQGGTSALYRLYAEWGLRPPLLKLDEEHKHRGRDALCRLGMPRDASFVCIHVREQGYSPIDEIHMDFRNADPMNLMSTIQEVIARGEWCIRIGDTSGQQLPALTGLIDYPHSDEKSDFMDVFLCAECRVFLGGNSGIHFVSNIFGRPVALANVVPHAAVAPCPGNLSIPKLLRHKDSGKFLSFQEIMASPIANYQHSTAYKKNGLELVENDADDIRDLALELLDRLDGKWKSEPDDERLQKKYQALLQPGHFSYGTAGRIGTKFLRKYRNLLTGA